jgi:CRP/FNR family transcriptional regulator, cyclic AMP receptor protein
VSAAIGAHSSSRTGCGRGSDTDRYTVPAPGRDIRPEISDSGRVQWRLLADVPSDELQRVLTIARRRPFGRGEVVFHDGDPADSLHLVVSGRFAARIRTPLGDTTLLAIYGPGDAFGELALVSPPSNRSATVVALEAAETRSVFREDFEALRKRYPAVDRVLVALLADEIREMNDRLLEAHYVDAETRVRRHLRRLAALYDRDGTAIIPLTQEEIAEIAGTSRATVNRVLREEERRGVIKLQRGRTIVVEPDQLDRRAR